MPAEVETQWELVHPCAGAGAEPPTANNSADSRRRGANSSRNQASKYCTFTTRTGSMVI